MSNNFSILSELVKYRFRVAFVFAFLCLWTTLSWFLGTFADLAFIACLLAATYAVASWLARSGRAGACARFVRSSVAVFFWPAAILSSALACSAAFVLYHAVLAPAPFPAFEITNGEKTVVFQTMVHIATPEFYGDVRDNVENAKRAGYVLFYEGVGRGTPENERDFDRLLGLSLSGDFYDRFARVFGLVGQDNSRFLGLVNDRDRNVDLGIDDIMRLVRERLGTGARLPVPTISSGALLTASGGLDQAFADVRSLTPGARLATRWVGLATINFATKYGTDTLLGLAGVEGGPERRALFEAIIRDRDRHVADEIVRSPEKKIYLLYGLAHFNGVYAALTDADPRYHVVNSVEYYPFR